VVADAEAIRLVNPQRYEMEHLTAVVHIDRENHVIAGYKDVTDQEFWVRGHMPKSPLMPGVIMCEAAAQVSAYYVKKFKLIGGDFFGFSGLENVRFRGRVKPGDRLVLIGKMLKANSRLVSFNVQGFVAGTMVFHGDVIGMPLKFDPEGD
jgi:3-hydroxyacyl-[acyl-carrier-protein] dehydratase